MKDNEKLEKIKEIILDECGKAGVVVDRIILFGSRARGDNRDDSDFDIYVIIEDADFFKIRELYGNIQWALVKFEPEIDLIIRTKENFEKNKNEIGFVSYYANKEGKYLWMRK
jgi:predicted nucleotidyltransferase